MNLSAQKAWEFLIILTKIEEKKKNLYVLVLQFFKEFRIKYFTYV